MLRRTEDSPALAARLRELVPAEVVSGSRWLVELEKSAGEEAS